MYALDLKNWAKDWIDTAIQSDNNYIDKIKLWTLLTKKFVGVIKWFWGQQVNT